MSTVIENIHAYMLARPEGTVFVPLEFMAIGTREAVDQALSRMVRSGTITRLCRGAYAVNRETRFGVVPPAIELLVKGYAAAFAIEITNNEATAANGFGLSSQVPIQYVFLTSGPERVIEVGKVKVRLRHAPRWLTLFPNRPSGEAIRAIACMGEQECRNTVARLLPKVPREEWNVVERVVGLLPPWMALGLIQEGAVG